MHARPWTGLVPWQALLAPVLAVVLSVGMSWPLVLHLGSDVPQDLGDPLLNTWNVAWIGHAVVEHPFDLFQANTFWPEEDSLAFSDVLLGYGPAGVISAQGLGPALVVYNLLFLFTYVLAFLGAYLLARELGAPRLAAVVGGAAYAYAPFRLAQNGHLPVLSSGGIALALFLLVRGYRRRDARLVFAGWLVTTWQVLLGFTLGVQLAYLLLAAGVITAAYWVRRGRPPLRRALIVASAAGACVLVVVTFLQAQPYLRVLDEHPEAKRTPELVTFYSPPARAFLAAPEESLVWGGPTARARNSLPFPVEQVLFPGIAILLLAGLGLVSCAYPAVVRLWLAVGTLACGALSLGLRDEGHVTSGLTPYRVLYELGPGWEGFRTPGRVHTLTTLGLALLAAAGAALILREIRSRPLTSRSAAAPGRRDVAALCAAGVMTGLVLLEGFGPPPHVRVPRAPAGQLGAPAPHLHLPMGDLPNSRYTYWSIDGFPDQANGYGAFSPASQVQLRRVSTTFPDRRSVALLRDFGIRTVILHRDLAEGTPLEDAAQQSTRGLPLLREDRGGVVLYHLEPAQS
jgi:hypothetical protein